MIAPTSVGTAMCSPVTPAMANFSLELFDMERSFDYCQTYTVFSDHWTLCFYIIGAYLAAILAGRKYMQSRPAFQLKGALIVWNIVLASYSAFTAWRMVPILVYTIRHYGLHVSLCDVGSDDYRRVFGFWLLTFLVSKMMEFGDTAFIVLRKSPLIFLHWYHHVTVVFFTWSCGAYAAPMQFHFSTVNMVIHAIMYSYYALKAIGLHVPKRISMAITSLQLLQMLVGLFLTIYTYRAKAADQACHAADQVVTIAVVIYVSFFVLFCNFFIKAYVLKRQPKGVSNGAVKKLD